MKVLSPRQIIAAEPMFFGTLGTALTFMCAQLWLGTPVYFAAGVFGTFMIVILTLRRVGFASIAGILIFFQFFCQIGYSQVAKIISGAPGQSNLQTPVTTIEIILVGTAAFCTAALLVQAKLKNHRILALNPSVERLAHVRNITFPLGMFFLIYAWAFGASEDGERDYGGLVGICNQYSYIVYLSVLAETWRVLRMSDGRISVSRSLIFILAILEIRGFIQNGKLPMAAPVLMYFIASISYRGYATRVQLWAMVGAACIGVFIVYPMVQVSRSMVGATGLSVEAASEFLNRMLEHPDSVFEEFEEMRGETGEDASDFTAGLSYLGRADDLETRFVIISTTDMIAHAVEKQGLYGWGLVTEGFEAAMPTFLYADKPRMDTGDELVWFYNLRPCCDPAYPTIGYFADSFAAFGWIGVVIIPFLCGLIFFAEVQIGGAMLQGNFIGIYLVLKDIFFVGEGGNIAWFIIETIRNIPLDIVAIFAIFYAASSMGRARASAPGARR
jgi:hypothetical protein